MHEALETNTFGPILLAQAFVPLMQQQGYGRIVNVSSGMGQLEDMGGGYPAYRISKTALNAVTRVLASELAGTNIKVNSVCPGWVQTDMGSAGAPRTPQQGADNRGVAGNSPKRWFQRRLLARWPSGRSTPLAPTPSLPSWQSQNASGWVSRLLSQPLQIGA
ncbi:MAG TPA: SDR family NAD(P)-dependent oxidoreductase [Trichocoleus sp.]